jgi:O-antigen/teichoic acid export membrane protein
MRKRFSRLTGEALWVILGQLAVVLGSLVSVRVLTGLLEPSQYGQLALAVTVVTLANQTLMGGLANAFARYYAIAAAKNDVRGYASDALRLLTIASGLIVLTGLVLCVILLFAKHTGWVAPVLILIPLAVFNGSNACLTAFQNAARQRAVASLHAGMDAWLKIVCAVVVISVSGPSMSSALAGFTVAAALVFASQLAFLRKALGASLPALSIRARKPSWLDPMVSYSWPFSTWGIFTWAQQSSDRWALAAFASVASVGQYNVAYQLGYAPISLVTNMCSALLAPVFFSRAGLREDNPRSANVRLHIWITTLVAGGLTILAFVMALLLHKPIFLILVSEPFRESSVYFPWLVLGGGLFATGQMLTMQHMAELKPNTLVGVKILTAIFGCLAAFVGAFHLGIGGVVAAVVFFGAIYILAVLRSVLKDL